MGSTSRAMRLLTHNMLESPCRGVNNKSPLIIEPQQVEVVEQEFNPEFVKHMYPRLEWSALRSTATSLDLRHNFPEEVSEEHLANDDFLKQLHHVLLEVRVVEGNLVCPESGRKFPISKGVPNMLLRADEL